CEDIEVNGCLQGGGALVHESRFEEQLGRWHGSGRLRLRHDSPLMCVLAITTCEALYLISHPYGTRMAKTGSNRVALPGDRQCGRGLERRAGSRVVERLRRRQRLLALRGAGSNQ